MATNLQGSSHRPRAVGGAYETERVLFMKSRRSHIWLIISVIVVLYFAAAMTVISIIGSWFTDVPGPCTEFVSYSTPSKGDVRVPVFIVSFADTEKDPQMMSDEDIRDIFFDENDQYSFRSWMNRSSYGQLNVDGDVFFYQARNKMKDYEGDEEYEFEPLAEEVLQAFDDEIDYSEYDSNDDGCIDAFFLNIIGADDYFYGTQNTWYADQDFSLDGVWPANYVIDDAQPLDTDEDREYYVQVAAHEFGHCMGLPDLYKLGLKDDYEAMNGIAGTEMMDEMYGDYSQFSKVMLGWLDNSEIRICRDAGEFYLPASPVNGGCVIIPRNPDLSDSETLTSEYFLLQYDTAEGNMADVLSPEDEGVRILHCDAETYTNEYGETIFRYEDQSQYYDKSHKKQRIMRLVNDGGEYFKTGDIIDKSTPGFAWYDDAGQETIDPGYQIKIKEADDDGITIEIGT